MPTLAVGSSLLHRPKQSSDALNKRVSKKHPDGFTLLELLVVIVIMAVATAGVGLALRGSASTQLERDAQRLAALLESARAQSRLTTTRVTWRAKPSGFSFEGLAASEPLAWLGSDTQAIVSGDVRLGPEPIIQPQKIRLTAMSEPQLSVYVVTDGVRPFAVRSGDLPESIVGK